MYDSIKKCTKQKSVEKESKLEISGCLKLEVGVGDKASDR